KVVSRALALVKKCLSTGAAAVLELPFASPAWGAAELVALCEKPGVGLHTTASCSHGSSFLKRHRFLSARCCLTAACKPCTCVGKHRPVRGKSARPNRSHVPGLAFALADCFETELRGRAALLREQDLDVAGLERIALSDLALSLDWTEEEVWAWKGQVHINILEASALGRLFKRVALESAPLRFCALCDSQVARCAVIKGRSPSPGLRHATRRTSALCLAAGLYPAGLFCPTRWIPADGPTRDRPIDPPVSTLGPGFWDREKLYRDGTRARLKRWAANWVRLAFAVRPALASLPLAPSESRYAGLPFRAFLGLDFDSTLGYPGEGPPYAVGFTLGLSFLLGSSPLLTVGCRGRFQVFGVFYASFQVAFAMEDLFASWLLRRGRIWEGLLDLGRREPEQVNEVFIWYGQWLYEEGLPYYHYAETLNAFTTESPNMRRQLQAAWDLAFAWQRQEPPTHHTALPWQVLLALLSIALLWGWDDVAGILALCWGGLARVGEAMAARRCDLVLPEDVGKECGWGSYQVFMSILEPKTRFKSAKHQCLKVDQPDLVAIVIFAFEKLSPGERLWSRSGSTLRNRFRKLLLAAGLQERAVPELKDFDLASLRAGGATWLMLTTESPDYVRRRGRWITTKVMEIYIQEVSSLMYLPRLPAETRAGLFAWANGFHEAFAFALWCRKLSIQPHLRLSLLKQGLYNA
ncbi:mok12, partial [Symbiodinium necroappetens]